MTETIVNAGWETFELTDRDPTRTTLVRPEDGKIIYKASTEDTGSKQTTTYTDAAGNVIATLEWHLVKADKLTFHGKDAISVNKWLKTSKMKLERTASITTSGGQTYTWTGFKSKDTFAPLYLYGNGESAANALATFAPAVSPTGSKLGAPARLSLSSAVQASRDEVVLSLLIIEKDRRFSGGTMHTTLMDRVILGISGSLVGSQGGPIGGY